MNTTELDDVRGEECLEIHRGERHVLERVRRADASSVILKKRRPGAQGGDSLRDEHDHLQRLRAAGVANVAYPIDLVEGAAGPTLVLRDAGPVNLEGWLRRRPLPVEQFLDLAVQLVEILGNVHRQGMVHGGVNPSNIVLGGDGQRVTLVDFGHASAHPGNGSAADEPASPPYPRPGGSPLYLAPEQTGRLARPLDQRTDLYSLGVTLYQMLTGGPPFWSEDPAEMIHAHLARIPPSPGARNPAAPELLSAMVMRLLGKMPEERYQSADALLADLRESTRQWRGTGTIAPFELGQLDWGSTLADGGCYGRQADLAALEQAVERVRGGGCELHLVSGPAGIGKSNLLAALRRRLGEGSRDDSPLFLTGKCEALGAQLPYGPFVQAVRPFFRDLGRLSAVDLAPWRGHLQRAMGPNLAVIAHLVPELVALLGGPPPAPAPGQRTTELRSRLTFQALLGAISQGPTGDGPPLVLELDDLHWADPDTLALIRHLAEPGAAHHLLLIGTFRADELSADHPLRALTGDGVSAGAGGAPLGHHLALGPLALESLAELCAELCACGLSEVLPLARLVRQKTDGNPLFALQFVRELQGAGVLRRDPLGRGWRWDLDQVQAASVTDNVAQLLTEAVARLPPDTRTLLEIAACLRGPAEVWLLAAVAEQSQSETARRLWPALREGLLIPVPGESPSGERKGDLPSAAYRFAHDRIKIAAHSLLDAPARARLHLTIGRRLQAHSGPPGRPGPEEKLLDIADHLDQAVHLIDDPAERMALAELHQRAAEHARRTGSLGAALTHARTALALLPPDSWQSMHDKTLALHHQAIECAFLTGDAAGGQALLDSALERAGTRSQKAELYALMVNVEVSRNQLGRAMECGRQGLRLLEIEFDPSASSADELQALRRKLAERPLSELRELPPMRDPEALAAMDLLLRAAVPAAIQDRGYWSLVVIRALQLSLEHGNAPDSSYAYVGVGVLLALLPDDDGGGEALAEVGIELARAHRDPQVEARSVVMFVVLGIHWRRPLQAHLPALARAASAFLGGGDFQMASFAMLASASAMFHSGIELSRVDAECVAALKLMRHTRAHALRAAPLVYREIVLLLQSPRPRGTSIIAPTPTGPDRESEVWRQPYPAQLVVPIVLRDLPAIAERLALLRGTLRDLDSVRYSFASPWFTFHTALAATMVYEQSSPARQQQLWADLTEDHQSLVGWGARAPELFQHRADLVAAEMARLQGRPDAALALYDRAIECAHQARVLHEEALALELAARCRIQAGLSRTAAGYLSAARDRYARWGATAKVAALDEEFADRLGRALVDQPEAGAHAGGGSGEGTPDLDLRSLLKAAESIAYEVDLDPLLERLLAVCLEVAGARRGVLVLDLEDGQGLAVRATGTLSEPISLERTALGRAERVPRSLVEHVFHAGQTVALADASAPGPFQKDPHFAGNQVRSALALPIVRQGRSIGVCYLENDLASYGFPARKVRILTLLSAQIAISLESYRLFEELRVEVRERTRAERSVRFLAEAAAALAQSLDYPTTLAEVARLAIPFLADWCSVELLDRQGRLVPLASAPPPPVATGQPPVPPVDDRRSPSRQAIEQRAPVVINDPSEARRAELWDQFGQAAVPHLKIRSLMAVPLFARGRALGAITLATTGPGRNYGPPEIALGEELARRAAIAIDNARLHQEAQDAVRLREEFLVVASHELNTPVASLRLLSQSVDLTGDLPPPDVVRRVLSLVDRQSARLAALIGEVFDVSRVRAGFFHPKLQQLDLGALVRATLDRMRDQAGRVSCSLQAKIAEDLCGTWDRVGVERIVVNLLSNAMKFGRGKPIEVELHRQGAVAHLTVRDHGIGIDPERLPRIFERFERGVSAEHYGGLGLGLYIVREIVTALGGTVDATSTPGQGSTFAVALPIRGPISPAPPP